MLGLKSSTFSPEAAQRLMAIARGVMHDVERIRDRPATLWECVTGQFDCRVDLAALDRAVSDAEALAKKHPREAVEWQSETISTVEVLRRLKEMQTTLAPLRGRVSQ